MAANPSAPLAALQELVQDQEDLMARFSVAQNPSVDLDTLRHLASDRIDMVANAARKRLGLEPRFVVPVIPRIDLATRRVVR